MTRTLACQLWCVSLVAASFPAIASAQPPPLVEVATALHHKFDLSLSFSTLSVRKTGDSNRTASFGVEATAQLNVRKNLGLVLDLGVHSDLPSLPSQDGPAHCFANNAEWLLGPRFTAHREKTTAFVHVLFGGSSSCRAGISDKALMMGYGGGIDRSAGDNVDFRLVQVDWLPRRENGAWAGNRIRLGFGLVIKSKK